MTVAMELRWGACSDTGVRRAVNEDAYLAGTPVFLVADGMGGHTGGAAASLRALDGFRALVGSRTAGVDAVHAAFTRAVTQVREIGDGPAAPGTTLSGVVVCEQFGIPHWLVLNIGDSRTYRFAGGALEQISIDHSAVQMMVDDGTLSLAEAERHPERHVITRAVGAGSSGLPDYWLFPVGHHDRILICSDGLTKEVPSVVIDGILRAEQTAAGAAQRLVREALERGGRDNVTVVVVDALLADAGDDQVDEDTVPRSPLAEEASRVEV